MTAAWLSAASSLSAAAATEGLDTGAPPYMWGIGTLIIFLLLLWMTLAFGKGRG